MAFHKALKGKKLTYLRVTMEESPPLPMLQFPSYLLHVNILSQSTVWIEESLNPQLSHRCRLLTYHHKYCFPQPWMKSRMKRREAHAAQAFTCFPAKSFRAWVWHKAIIWYKPSEVWNSKVVFVGMVMPLTMVRENGWGRSTFLYCHHPP